MGPVGQGGGGPAGCGWGLEADLIPAHRPMMSRTRTIQPIPIHLLAPGARRHQGDLCITSPYRGDGSAR
jgi:hypothetical protein